MIPRLQLAASLTAASLSLLACGQSAPAAGASDAGDLLPDPDAGITVDAGQPPVDAGVLATRPFLEPTSGGGALDSPNHRLELFVAPATIVGESASPHYRLELGPGAARATPRSTP